MSAIPLLTSLKGPEWLWPKRGTSLASPQLAPLAQPIAVLGTGHLHAVHESLLLFIGFPIKVSFLSNSLRLSSAPSQDKCISKDGVSVKHGTMMDATWGWAWCPGLGGCQSCPEVLPR